MDNLTDSLDKKLRERLQGYSPKPPPGMWKKVKSSGIPDKGIGALMASRVWIPAAVILAGLSTLLWFFTHVFHQGEGRYTPRDAVFCLETLDHLQQKDNDGEAYQMGHLQEEPVYEHAYTEKGKVVGRGSSRKSLTEEHSIVQIQPTPVMQTAETETDDRAEPEVGELATEKLSEVQVPLKGTAQKLISQTYGLNGLLEKRRPLPPELKAKRPWGGLDTSLRAPLDFQRDAFMPDESKGLFNRPFSLGITWNGARVFNTMETRDKALYETGIGLEGRYFTTNQSFLQTGIGVYQTTDSWDYVVDFQEPELLGHYTAVDSISYTTVTGSAGQDSLVITYHTHQAEVYDTVNLRDETYTTKRYTYLAIPLMTGYSGSHNRFVYSLSTGVMVSVLIHQKFLYDQKDHLYSNITGVQDFRRTRVTTNWHYVLAGGAGYQINHRWTAMIEPHLKVYFNPVYEKNSRGNSDKIPFSAGLNAGIYYGF